MCYLVKVCISYEDNEGTHDEVDNVVVVGDSYSDAVTIIENYYGRALSGIDRIRPVCNDNVVIFNNSVTISEDSFKPC